jgi:hypothetical protein
MEDSGEAASNRRRPRRRARFVIPEIGRQCYERAPSVAGKPWRGEQKGEKAGWNFLQEATERTEVLTTKPKRETKPEKFNEPQTTDIGMSGQVKYR